MRLGASLDGGAVALRASMAGALCRLGARLDGGADPMRHESGAERTASQSHWPCSAAMFSGHVQPRCQIVVPSSQAHQQCELAAGAATSAWAAGARRFSFRIHFPARGNSFRHWVFLISMIRIMYIMEPRSLAKSPLVSKAWRKMQRFKRVMAGFARP